MAPLKLERLSLKAIQKMDFGVRRLQVRLIFVTPAIARWLLERYAVQIRNISKSQVQKLTRIMLSGEYYVNGETVVFSPNRLVNGVHRLQACVVAGQNDPTFKGIPMLVVLGVESALEIEGSFDQPQPRSHSQNLKLLGVKYHKDVAAIVKIVDWLDQGHRNLPRKLATSEVVQLSERDKDGIEYVVKNFLRGKKDKTALRTAPVAAAFIYAWPIDQKGVKKMIAELTGEVDCPARGATNSWAIKDAADNSHAAHGTVERDKLTRKTLNVLMHQAKGTLLKNPRDTDKGCQFFIKARQQKGIYPLDTRLEHMELVPIQKLEE